MAQESDPIQEFCDIIDTAIQQDVATSFGTSFDTGKVARKFGHVFASLGPRDVRVEPIPSLMGAEHTWAISPDEVIRIGKYSGRLAVVAFAGPDEYSGLYRNWVPTGGGLLRVVHNQLRQLNDDEIEPTLAWARSPHLNQTYVRAIAALTDVEQEQVETYQADSAASEKALQERFTEMERAVFRVQM